MKMNVPLLLSVLVLFGSLSAAQATSLFTEDFEGALGAWTGKLMGAHNGVIVADPLGGSGHALSFTALNSAGDVFTASSFTTGTGNFFLSFDYLGLAKPGSVAGDLGGFVGIDTGFPALERWVLGTQDSYPGLLATLPDDGAWHHITLSFSAALIGPTIHLKLEDWDGSGGVPGDAYFDNFTLSDNAPTTVPEPGTLSLLAAALVAAGVFVRRGGTRKT